MIHLSVQKKKKDQTTNNQRWKEEHHPMFLLALCSFCDVPGGSDEWHGDVGVTVLPADQRQTLALYYPVGGDEDAVNTSTVHGHNKEVTARDKQACFAGSQSIRLLIIIIMYWFINVLFYRLLSPLWRCQQHIICWHLHFIHILDLHNKLTTWLILFHISYKFFVYILTFTIVTVYSYGD